MEAASARVLKLGPDGYTGIAIIGSAPSSVRLAPFHDKTWAIWGCSPGAYGIIPYGRSDVWFEVHRYEPPIAGDPNNAQNKGWFSPEYVQFLKEHAGPVYLAGPDPEVDNPIPDFKNGWRFPFEDYVAKYGGYFFTSSMAWMLAHAIELLAPRAAAGEKVRIGLWGVDMAALSEYNLQRPGCQHFLGLAKSLGIQIVLPPESDLLQPPTLYGVSEYHPRHTKWLARMNELKGRQQALTVNIQNMSVELQHINGCIDNMNYVFNTWVDDIDPGMDITSAVSLAGVVLSRPEPKVAAIEKFDGPTAAQLQAATAALQIADKGNLFPRKQVRNRKGKRSRK
jgi:hypothetical protein